MFLRSLTLRGFKSFAAKTTLEFTPGVSVIVGPNGSGKSNISDAVAWALGEQGARALRGGQMTDVIFAGSPARPALGLAEVKIVIDNSAGLIPVPASEIEISRTIFRSGDSEYRLGGVSSRLLDVQELLSDTGVGRGLHTLVGQGQLDDVLQARPEERRQFIEEAAGIAKHRRRRERAERKLAGLEQDLLRLHDVVSELRRRLKPLRHQAELAARHEALTTEAATLTARLAAVRLRDLYRRRERALPEWERAEGERRRARELLDEVGAAIARLENQRAEVEAAERTTEARLADAMKAKSEAEASLRSAVSREAEAQQSLSRTTQASGRLFALEEELERTQRALNDVEATFAEREDELARAEAAFREKEHARRETEERRRHLVDEASTRRAEAEALARTLVGHEAEAERLGRMFTELEARIAHRASRGREIEADIERLDAIETPLAKDDTDLQHQQEKLSRELADLDATHKGLLARQEVIDARRNELSESPGAAFARTRSGTAIGVLGDLIGAPDDLARAVTAALGPLADAVVYSRADEAIADARRAGGVTLSWEPDASSPPSLSGVPSLLDSVRPDPRIGNLATALLGDVYLTGNAEEARALASSHPRLLFVTTDGLLIAGAFVRAPAGASAAGERLRRQSAALERELSSLRRELRERRQLLEEVSARREEMRRRLEDADAQITSAAERLASAKAELSALERERDLLRDRMAVVDASAEDVRRRLAGIPQAPAELPPLPPHAEPPVLLRIEVEALRRDRSRLAAGVARALRDIDSLRTGDPEKLGEELAAAQSDRSAAEQSLQEAADRLTEAAAAHRSAAAMARRARDDAAEANRAWREHAEGLERIRRAYEEGDRERLDLERRIGEAERLLREGHGIDPGDAASTVSDDESVESIQRQADLVSRRLALIGRVNLLAPGELESLTERHEFVSRELEDVQAARKDLHRVIEDVDRQIAQLFASAFTDVSREFKDLFATLFPGGEGNLVLTDADDLLHSGIEVEARPGGKRVKRLSLLSGGERSLAALAFLFAIFRSRPSPFYLMDEVEAALDDVNLHRFLGVVRELAERSQILIVTHQKRTMEMADVLYGVSMGKDGSSTVISQRLAAVGTG